jgi:hypothetical protein
MNHEGMEKMNDTANTSTETPLEEVPQIKVKFYRNRRIFIAGFMSLCIFIVTEKLFLLLLSHVMLTMFWDWWFFTFRGYIDSTRAPEAYFQWAKVTTQQMDGFNGFMIKLRRIAFTMSVLTALTCYFFVEEVGYYTAFLFTYLGIVIIPSGIAMLLGKIKYPYLSPNQNQASQWSYSMGVIHSPMYNAASDNKLTNPYS